MNFRQGILRVWKKSNTNINYGLLIDVVAENGNSFDSGRCNCQKNISHNTKIQKELVIKSEAEDQGR